VDDCVVLVAFLLTALLTNLHPWTIVLPGGLYSNPCVARRVAQHYWQASLAANCKGRLS